MYDILFTTEMVVNGARVTEKNEFEFFANTGKIYVITGK